MKCTVLDWEAKYLLLTAKFSHRVTMIMKCSNPKKPFTSNSKTFNELLCFQDIPGLGKMHNFSRTSKDFCGNVATMWNRKTLWHLSAVTWLMNYHYYYKSLTVTLYHLTQNMSFYRCSFQLISWLLLKTKANITITNVHPEHKYDVTKIK